MAKVATESTEPEVATKTVATYLPGKGIRGVTRLISKKDAKTVEVDLESDLEWSAANGHRVDVSNVPEALLEVLKDDPDFKISHENA